MFTIVTTCCKNVAWVLERKRQTGVEGLAIALNLGVAVNSETGANGDSPANSLASLVVSAIPLGAVLSDGTNTFTATTGHASVDVHTWAYTSLTIKPANDTNFTLTMAANGWRCSRRSRLASRAPAFWGTQRRCPMTTTCGPPRRWLRP
jgi:hypothetical protein